MSRFERPSEDNDDQPTIPVAHGPAPTVAPPLYRATSPREWEMTEEERELGRAALARIREQLRNREAS